MGTRGLLGFIILGQRYATYNHWDSYPEGLGKDIVNFILGLTPEDYTAMARLVAEITWVDSESAPSPELQERYQKLGFADLSVSNRSLEEWYCLLRKTQGAAALPAIQSGDLKHVVESCRLLVDVCLLSFPLTIRTAFEDDYWEWAYFIDFEHRMLETWKRERETVLDVVSFESLIKGGVEKYLAQVNDGEEEEWDNDDDDEEEEEEEEA
jgi:hypothetical protein